MRKRKVPAKGKRPVKPLKPTQVGVRLKAIRQAAGISANALSLAAGASHTVVTQIETGAIVDPRARVLGAIAKALGCSIEYLLDGQGRPPSTRAVQAAFISASEAQDQ